MENKKTAVEWAFAMLGKMSDEKIKLQAKQMEKEQIIQFADEYADAVMGGCINRAKQYYNETCKQEDNEL